MSARPPILLIDDDRTWLESLSEYLREKGFPVVTADDGRRGLALLEQSAPAVAVVDVNMPAMDGFEFLRQAHRRRHDLPILLLSADDEPPVAARARAQGAWAFLPKTKSLALLLVTIRQALAAAGREPGERSPQIRWDRLLPAPRKRGWNHPRACLCPGSA
jgi:CheY-like chemotaxis protein